MIVAYGLGRGFGRSCGCGLGAVTYAKLEKTTAGGGYQCKPDFCYSYEAPAVDAAIKELQKLLGLTADGKLGKGTADALQKALAGKSVADPYLAEAIKLFLANPTFEIATIWLMYLLPALKAPKATATSSTSTTAISTGGRVTATRPGAVTAYKDTTTSVNVTPTYAYDRMTAKPLTQQERDAAAAAYAAVYAAEQAAKAAAQREHEAKHAAEAAGQQTTTTLPDGSVVTTSDEEEMVIPIPLYKRGWFWAVVGGSLVIVGGGLILAR